MINTSSSSPQHPPSTRFTIPLSTFSTTEDDDRPASQTAVALMTSSHPRLVLLLLVGSPLLLLVCRPVCVLEVDSEDGLDGDGDDLQLVDAQQVAVAVDEVADVRELVRAGDWQVVAHGLSCG